MDHIQVESRQCKFSGGPLDGEREFVPIFPVVTAATKDYATQHGLDAPPDPTPFFAFCYWHHQKIFLYLSDHPFDGWTGDIVHMTFQPNGHLLAIIDSNDLELQPKPI